MGLYVIFLGFQMNHRQKLETVLPNILFLSQKEWFNIFLICTCHALYCKHQVRAYSFSSTYLFLFTVKFQPHVPTIKECMYPTNFPTKSHRPYLKIFNYVIDIVAALFSWFSAFYGEVKMLTLVCIRTFPINKGYLMVNHANF